jgi:hypothetical protein
MPELHWIKEFGPIVIEIPPGPITAAANDMNQLYIMDMDIPGPDKGKGGKHVILPPDFKGTVPSGFYILVSNHI